MLACFACERGVTRRARGGPRDGGRRTHSFGPMEIYFLFFFGKSVQRYRIVSHTTTCIISHHFPIISDIISGNVAERRRTTPLLWAGEAEPSRDWASLHANERTPRTRTRTNACREHHPSHRRRREHPTRWYQKGFRQEAGGQGAFSRREWTDATRGCACGNREWKGGSGDDHRSIDRSIRDARSVTLRRDGCAGGETWGTRRDAFDVVHGQRATRRDPIESLDGSDRSPDRAL